MLLKTFYFLNIMYTDDTFIEQNIRMSENANLYKPTIRPQIRDYIYDELNTYGFDYLAKKYFRIDYSLKNRIKNMFPRRFFSSLK